MYIVNRIFFYITDKIAIIIFLGGKWSFFPKVT